jgi:hypothetical protein
MDTQSSAFTRNLTSFVGLLMASALATAQEDPTAVVLYVATNAVHNGTGCGVLERPCRSISQAVANAAAGNLIEVRPGIYGDIDGDGDASSAGEEAVVTIDKGVTVYSAGGAAQTIIRARRSAQTGTAVVRITSNDATFGQPDGGFTIVGDKSGLGEGSVGVDVTATSNVMIAGNIAMDNGAGGFVVTVPLPFGLRQVVFLDNVATRNLFGFGVTVEGSVVGGFVCRVRLARNTAADNDQQGFLVSSTGRQCLLNNLATRNQTGFDVGGGENLILNNMAVANAQAGIQTRGPAVGPFGSNDVRQNTVIGNGIAGFRLLPSSHSGIFQRNNIFGNGEAATGCGLINERGASADATNNYWGKPSGPGPNPGDRAHKDCGEQVAADPFSTVPFFIHGPSTD